MFCMCKNKIASKVGLKLQETEMNGVFCRSSWRRSVVALLALWYILLKIIFTVLCSLTVRQIPATVHWHFFDSGQPHIGFIDDDNKYRVCKTVERSAVISDLERWAAAGVACTCHRGRRRGRNTWTDRSGFSPPVSCPGWSGPCPPPHASAALKHAHGQTSMCQTLLPESHYIIFQQFVELPILFCLLSLVIHFLE